MICLPASFLHTKIVHYLAMYLVIMKFRNKLIKVLILSLILIFFVNLTYKNYHKNFEEASFHFTQLSAWKTCYLNYQSVEFCYDQVSWYPFPKERIPELKVQLKKLTIVNFNLFPTSKSKP